MQFPGKGPEPRNEPEPTRALATQKGLKHLSLQRQTNSTKQNKKEKEEKTKTKDEATQTNEKKQGHDGCAASGIVD